MRLGDLDVHDLIDALETERSAWINIQKEQLRHLTEAERATIYVLTAIESALRNAVSTQEGHGHRVEGHAFDDAVLDGLAKAMDDGKS
jgi:hypothetical protein